MKQANPRSDDNVPTGEPGAGYALVAAAFGLLFIYLGGLIPFRILSWPVIGIGALFVVAMTSYAVVVLWKAISRYPRSWFRRAWGHVRDDPQLGTLTRDPNAHCWVATVPRSDRTVDVVIEGDDEPHAVLLAHARELLARFDTLEQGVDEYLGRQAEQESSRDPEIAAEIRALRISSVRLRSPERPGHVEIDFDGPEEMRYWYCDYINGKFTGLTFDT